MASYHTKNSHSSHTNPNKSLLENADELQRQSTEAARRCQQKLSETEELGISTLDEIRNQNTTMNNIQDSADMTNAKLEHSHKLLNRYDRWAFHWYGRNKRQARKEGKQATKEMKVLEKKDKDQRQKIESKKVVVSHYGSTEENRSQLFPSSKQPRIRTVDALPFDVDSETTAPSRLDEETKEHLQRIEGKDHELDSMLNDMAESLNRLSHVSKLINDDTNQGSKQMDHVIAKVDQVNHKQVVVQGRLRRNLNK